MYAVVRILTSLCCRDKRVHEGEGGTTYKFVMAPNIVSQPLVAESPATLIYLYRILGWVNICSRRPLTVS